jgi:HemY protein
MRTIIWFILLFGVAVVAASTLGMNDGLVVFYWRGWRFDLSLNLFLLSFMGSVFVLVSVIKAIQSLLALPQRAHDWRAARGELGAQAALRESLAQYFGGRYSRAQTSARRALALQNSSSELAQDLEFTVLAHLLTAGSAHRLLDRGARDKSLRHAQDLARLNASARSAEEGAHLLAAEWALDDRDAPRALELLAQLPMGVARRTHALRLKLQATRLGQQPQEALKTARLLAKHQGFSSVVAQSLLRSLAFESLNTAFDMDQLRQVWLQLEPVDRRDPLVAARACERAAQLNAFDEARTWLQPLWHKLATLAPDERSVVAQSLGLAVKGIGPDWLPGLEAALKAFPREGAIAFAVGMAMAQRQLWGKARLALEQAASDTTLPAPARRQAWLTLAQLAQLERDPGRAARNFEAAARLAVSSK